LQFVLAADEFASIIPGASKPEQVEDNVKALDEKFLRISGKNCNRKG
jgi:D-threo-aldose 1-dehydrogenase